MSKQLIPLTTLISDMNADRYVSTLAFFDAVRSEIPLSFVVTAKATKRHDDIRTSRQYVNTTTHFLTPEPPVPSTALTLI